jgi:hypothetical protein
LAFAGEREPAGPRRKVREEVDPGGSGDERNAASGHNGRAQPEILNLNALSGYPFPL